MRNREIGKLLLARTPGACDRYACLSMGIVFAKSKVASSAAPFLPFEVSQERYKNIIQCRARKKPSMMLGTC